MHTNHMNDLSLGKLPITEPLHHQKLKEKHASLTLQSEKKSRLHGVRELREGRVGERLAELPDGLGPDGGLAVTQRVARAVERLGERRAGLRADDHEVLAPGLRDPHRPNLRGELGGRAFRRGATERRSDTNKRRNRNKLRREYSMLTA